MKLTDLRVSLMDLADKSDPLNQTISVALRAKVDGKLVYWSGQAHYGENGKERFERILELAIGRAILDLLENPNRDCSNLRAPALPQVLYDIPEWAS